MGLLLFVTVQRQKILVGSVDSHPAGDVTGRTAADTVRDQEDGHLRIELWRNPGCPEYLGAFFRGAACFKREIRCHASAH